MNFTICSVSKLSADRLIFLNLFTLQSLRWMVYVNKFQPLIVCHDCYLNYLRFTILDIWLTTQITMYCSWSLTVRHQNLKRAFKIFNIQMWIYICTTSCANFSSHKPLFWTKNIFFIFLETKKKVLQTTFKGICGYLTVYT